MALSNNKVGGGVTYATISGGFFKTQADENTPGAVARVNKLGAKVWELSFSTLSGFIKEIKHEDTKYGKRTNIKFVDSAGVMAVLSLNYTDNTTATIYKMLPNVDPSKEVAIVVAPELVDGKTFTKISLVQEGQYVRYAYTNANPQGMPMVEEVIVNGQKVKNRQPQIEWLLANAVDPFLQKVNDLKVVGIVNMPDPVIPEKPKSTAPTKINEGNTIDYGEAIDPDSIPF